MNAKPVLIYTTETGGHFKVAAVGDQAVHAYAEAVETGHLRVPRGDWWPGSTESRFALDVEPKFIALATVNENHDFVLGRSRDVVAA